MIQPHTKLLYPISTIIMVHLKQILNNEKWIYIYTNLLPFLLQYWVVVFLFYRHCRWLQEQLYSPREDNDLWDAFCLLQCWHLWHPLILLWNNCVLFNQIQLLQFASYSLEIEMLIISISNYCNVELGSWGRYGALTVTLCIFISNIWLPSNQIHSSP